MFHWANVVRNSKKRESAKNSEMDLELIFHTANIMTTRRKCVLQKIYQRYTVDIYQ